MMRNLQLTGLKCSIVLFSYLSVAILPADERGTWAHDTSDLKPDPSVAFGVLENGIRYVIMPNNEPPKRLSLRLFVDAGSLMETEEQQGLAHFIEHMAFNGTKNFPAGEMVEYFQRLGMSFGGDTNAHTSFKETVYKLELPKPDEALIKRALLLLRDYADGMLMSEPEIDKERGVILSELLTRDSAEWRTQKVAYKFALPDCLISKRFPIGTKKVINGAGRGEFMDFYKSWYTPERMAVVITGAVEADKILPLIKEQFASMKPVATPKEDPQLGKITTGRGVIAKTHFEKEATETNVSIEVVRPYTWQPDNSKKRVRDMSLGIASGIINNRLSERVKKKGAVITGGGCYAQDFMDFVRFSSIYVTCEPDKWSGALAVAEQEIRRALSHGFTRAEFDEVVANMRNGYEQAERSAASRKSRGLADRLVSSISRGKVFSSPKQTLEWFNRNISLLSPEVCVAGLRNAWNSGDRQLFIGGNVKIAGGDEEIIGIYEQARRVSVEPPREEKQSSFAYTSFGKPGKIVDRVDIKDLGVTQLRFSNNVRLNLKRTDFEKDTISIGVRIGGGLLTLPEGKPGLQLAASAAINAGGLEEHSVDELRRLFAGKTANVSFSVGEDAFGFSGVTNRKDFSSAMELLTAYLVAPGYREEALRQLHKNLDPIYAQLAYTPMGVFNDQVDVFLKKGDFRAGFPKRSELVSRTFDEVKQWLGEALRAGFMEVAIVGDFEEEDILRDVARTLGALPERSLEKPRHAERRVMHFASGGQSKTFEFNSEIPKGMIGVYWPTEDIWDIGRTRRLSVMGAIFADRLRKKVREELGEAYSPYARNISSSSYSDFGYMMSMITVDPSQADKIAGVVRGIGEELATEGTSADELERALKPLLNGIDQQLRQNSYWLSTVALSSQEFPQKIEWARTMVSDYKSIKVDEVNKLARKYLKPERSVIVKIIPVGAKPAGK
ncbi:MAG: insulinase family protein [Verrucomicrobiaceae bacterium]|nr:insulinase family protein [Verrucomicrobiaceae bacterium]